MMYKKCCTHQFPAASWQVVSQQKTPCALGHNTSSKSCNPDFRVSQQIPLTEWVYPMKCILLEWEELLKNRFLSYGHPECILQRNLLVQIEFVFVAFIALQVGISLVVRNNQWKRKDRLVTCPTGRSDLKRTSRSNMIRLNEWPLRKKERKTERNKHSVPPKSPYSFVHFLPKKNRFLPHIQPILINGSEVSNNAMRTSTGMKQPTSQHPRVSQSWVS